MNSFLTFRDYLLLSSTRHHLLTQVRCLPGLESWHHILLIRQSIVITIITSGYYYVQDYNRPRQLRKSRQATSRTSSKPDNTLGPLIPFKHLFYNPYNSRCQTIKEGRNQKHINLLYWLNTCQNFHCLQTTLDKRNLHKSTVLYTNIPVYIVIRIFI